MAEAQDMKESRLTGRLGLAAAVSATAAASILLAAYRSTLYSLHERGTRGTAEVLAVPLHTATNRSR
jgi:hypothetical protein